MCFAPLTYTYYNIKIYNYLLTFNTYLIQVAAEETAKDLNEEIQNVCTETVGDQQSCGRHMSYLNKELEKKNPDEDTVTFYMDLLFDKRRKETALGINGGKHFFIAF